MPFPERWLVLTARMPADDPLRDLLVEGLLALGGLSVLDEGEELTTYLEPTEDPALILKRARRFLADWIADDPPELTWRWQANEDWEREWRRGLQPRRISPRIVVKPSWTEWAAGAGEVVLEIDPQMAFGTGEHATTRGVLRLLDDRLRTGDRVLDVGSGSGILSIAASKLGASEVVAVEFDPDANLNARENMARNRVANRIRLHERVADAEFLASLGRFDLITANILSSVIRPLLPALAAALEPGGRLIVSGILATEAAAVTTDAARVGLGMDGEEREEEWWSAALEKLA